MTITTVTPTLSVIVPTRNEAANVKPLVQGLVDALDGETIEIIFVDDSDDGTPGAIEYAQHRFRDQADVRLLHRGADDRHGGLSGAVVEGFKVARAPWAVVMDGDLQHPPETVPCLLARARLTDAQIVVASRYCGDGDASGLSDRMRRFVSTGATTFSKTLFPRRLHGCSDPMTGFFAVHLPSVNIPRLQPMGFKILLEVLVRNSLRIREVPFTFGERTAGESKASTAVGLLFLRQIANLWLEQRANRAMAFALVGATGIVANLLAMYVVLGIVPSHYLLAAAIATQVAITWNFLIIDRLFHTRSKHGTRRRYLSFLGINNLDLVVRLPMLWILVEHAGVNVYLATTASIVLAFGVRFALTDLVYRPHAPVPLPVPAQATAPTMEGDAA